jgi:pimeloyl-ACP methyl ester carboxylesterase
LNVRRASADSDTFSYNWLSGTNPFVGAPGVCAWLADASKLLELDSSGNWQPIAQTPVAGSTLIVINHGWNDGPVNNTGQAGYGLSDLARLVRSIIPTAHIYMWHWGDGDSVKSDANPNGKNGPTDFAAILNYLNTPNPSLPTITNLFVGDQLFHKEINITWSNAKTHGKNLGKVMKTLGLTPDNYDIHMIGHSFGGVVCAEAAKIINNKQTGKKVKQLTTLETPGLPWPYAVEAIKPELAVRVETIYYLWATDLVPGLGFGGPGYISDNLLNLHLMKNHYPWFIEPRFAILHSRAVEWYIDSINNTTSCTPDYYGFNWSFTRTDYNPSWPSSLSTGMMAEKMDARGCIEPWLPQRVAEGIAKNAVTVKDNFVSAATWTGNQAQIVGETVAGEFKSSLKITSLTTLSLAPMAMGKSEIIPLADGEPNTTAGVYKQMDIPLNAQNLELDIRFTSVVEGHFLAVTIDGNNVLLIDPYAEGVSDMFKTYSASVSEYAGKTVTLQITLQGASQEQTVVLIDSLQFTETTLGADVNEDGRVDVLDLIAMSEYWMGPVYAKGDASDKADITRDGKIDLDDFAMLAENWLWQKTE